MNQGKVFEQNFKKSCEKQNILCIRLNDSSTSFIMEKNARFTPQNPCDFITNCNGTMIPIECKSTEYNSFSIQFEKEEKNKMIKLHQINSMVQFSLFPEVYPCFIFNFRVKENDDSGEEITYLMHISDFSNFMAETDKKSINKLNIVQYGGIRVEQKKLFKNYSYNLKKAFEEMIEIQKEKSINSF